MKKICFLVKNVYNQGGDTRVVSILANEMCKEYEVTIVSFFKTANSPIFHFDEKIKIISMFEEPFNLRKNYFKVINKFKETINRLEIDILLVEAIGFNPFVYPVVRGTNIKVISCEHASYHDGGKILGMAWIGRRIACKYTDCVVVLTQQDLQDYKANMRKIRRIENIYNPIDSRIKTYSYNCQSKKIITCGRLVQIKGYDYLLEVAKEVFKQKTDWEWHIYGEGPERKNIEAKIREYGLENKVILKGEEANIYEKYRDYAFYVMPSKSEPFGMVLIEALKSGIPAISFDCKNGPREIISNGKNGFLIEGFNIGEMSRKICELIEDKELRIQLSNNIESTIEKFSINNIYNKWKKILQSI